jgi:hypothetical protein
MLVAAAPLVPLILLGVVVGAFVYKATKRPSAPLTDPDVKGDQPEPRPGPGPRPEEPLGEPYEKNPDENKIVDDLADGIMRAEGLTLEEKMVRCSTAADLLRRAHGGAAVNRCFQDQNEDQLPINWVTNLAFWVAYPRGPKGLKYSNSLYAVAWRRIKRRLIDKVADAGLLG